MAGERPASTNDRARAAAQAAHLKPGVKIKVRATQLGYYGDMRRRVDDVFIYTMGPTETKLPKWCERVADTTPERVTGPKDALRQHHDELLRERNAAAGADAGGLAPDSGESPLGRD